MPAPGDVAKYVQLAVSGNIGLEPLDEPAFPAHDILIGLPAGQGLDGALLHLGKRLRFVLLLAPQNAQRRGVESLDLALLPDQHDAVRDGVLNRLQQGLLLLEKARLPAQLTGDLQRAQIPGQVGHHDHRHGNREQRGRHAPPDLHADCARQAQHLIDAHEQDKHREYGKAAAMCLHFTTCGDK